MPIVVKIYPEPCEYFNYRTHTCTHTCDGCCDNCKDEKNFSMNTQCVWKGIDRYCMLKPKIKACEDNDYYCSNI
jgi:hypothetical protein